MFNVREGVMLRWGDAIYVKHLEMGVSNTVYTILTGGGVHNTPPDLSRLKPQCV